MCLSGMLSSSATISFRYGTPSQRHISLLAGLGRIYRKRLGVELSKCDMINSGEKYQILALRVVSLAFRLLNKMYAKRDGRVHPEPETSFLANLDQNIRIVHRVCHTYFPRDAVEREDVFQDIMYQLWKSYPQFKGESKFSTRIYKVALNTAITHIRRSTRGISSKSSMMSRIPESPTNFARHQKRALLGSSMVPL